MTPPGMVLFPNIDKDVTSYTLRNLPLKKKPTKESDKKCEICCKRYDD